jgi:hypothetical protein
MVRTALLAVLLSGCLLYESGGPSGDDSPDDPNGGPVGRTFSVDRIKDGPTECQFAGEDMTHSVSVDSVNTVFVDGIQPAGVVVRPGPAREDNFDSPNVVFAAFESWQGIEGGSASPMVQYEIWVDGGLITGNARTSFANSTPIGPPGCSYTWTLSGF